MIIRKGSIIFNNIQRIIFLIIFVLSPLNIFAQTLSDYEFCEMLKEHRDKDLYEDFSKSFDEYILNDEMLKEYIKIKNDLLDETYWGTSKLTEINLLINLLAETFENTMGLLTLNPRVLIRQGYKKTVVINLIKYKKTVVINLVKVKTTSNIASIGVEAYKEGVEQAALSTAVQALGDIADMWYDFGTKMQNFNDLKLLRQMVNEQIKATDKMIAEHNRKANDEFEKLSAINKYKEILDEFMQENCGLTSKVEIGQEEDKAKNELDTLNFSKEKEEIEIFLNNIQESTQGGAESKNSGTNNNSTYTYKTYLSDWFTVRYVSTSGVSNSGCISYKVYFTYVKHDFGSGTYCIYPLNGIRASGKTYQSKFMLNTYIGTVCVPANRKPTENEWNRHYSFYTNSCK